jgi:hypothetical protein
MSGSTAGAQFIRKMSLVIADQQGNGRELIVPNDAIGTALHAHFKVRHWVSSTPDTLEVRLYNPAQNTVRFIQGLGVTPSEWGLANSGNASSNGQIILKAGYTTAAYGTIFSGTIRYTRTGKEDATTTYCDIFASSSDAPHNWGIVNATLAAGYSQTDVANAVAKSKSNGQFGVTLGNPPAVSPGAANAVPVTPPAASPRGRALFGMGRDVLRDVAASHDNSWFFDGNNTIQFVPRTGYLDLPAIVLRSDTGLIGLPELTQDGVRARCLLNPNIGIGRRVQIANALIQQPPVNMAFTAVNFFPSTEADGFYKVLFVDHTGDNRGNDWYTDMLCLSIDPTAKVPITGAVLDLPTGIPP